MMFSKPKPKRKLKKTREWERERAKLKIEYEEKGIISCEIRLSGCMVNNFLSFAHRYKRNDPRCEHTFEGTLLACQNCHNLIEYNRELSERYFNLLR